MTIQNYFANVTRDETGYYLMGTGQVGETQSPKMKNETPVVQKEYVYLDNCDEDWNDLRLPARLFDKVAPYLLIAAAIVTFIGTFVGLKQAFANHNAMAGIFVSIKGIAILGALGWLEHKRRTKLPTTETLTEEEKVSEIKKLAGFSLRNLYWHYRQENGFGRFLGSLIPLVKNGILTPDEAKDLNDYLNKYENATDDSHRDWLDATWRSTQSPYLKIIKDNKINAVDARNETDALLGTIHSASIKLVDLYS